MVRRAFFPLIALLLLCHSWATSIALADKQVGLTVPACPWTLKLSSSNLVVEQTQVKPDGRHGYFLVTDNKNELTISIFIEPVVECKDSKECRDMVWKAGNPSWDNPQNVVLSEIGEVSCVEFMLKSVGGVPLQEQNLYAEFVVEGFWVDLHISRVLYKPKDHEIFERIVKSVKFEPKK